MARDKTQPVATALTAEQLRVLELLARSVSVAEAARQAGVHRSTVHRWLTADAEFIAARNVMMADALEHVRAVAHALAAEAVAAIRAELQNENSPKRAFVGLKLLELLGVGPDTMKPGPTDAEAVRARWGQEALDPFSSLPLAVRRALAS